MNEPGHAVLAALRYAMNHPRGLVVCAARAAGLRFTVPVDALRYAVSHLTGTGAPRDVVLECRPPGLRVAMTIDTAACPVRIDGTVSIEDVRASAQELRIAGRVQDIRLGIAGADDGSVLGRLTSAGLGLPNLGTWLRVVPIRPRMVVDARGDQVVLDLLRDDAFAQGEFARTWLPMIAPLLDVRKVETEADAVVIGIRLRPGFVQAWNAIRKTRPVAAVVS